MNCREDSAIKQIQFWLFGVLFLCGFFICLLVVLCVCWWLLFVLNLEFNSDEKMYRKLCY